MLGNTVPNEDANTDIALIIAHHLKNLGHDIAFLGLQKGKRGTITVDNITHHNVVYPSYYSENFELLIKSLQGLPLKKRLFALIQRPQFLLEYLLKRPFNRHIQTIAKRYKREVEKLGKIDLLIAVSAPFFAAYGASLLSKKTPLFYYQLDPFASHYETVGESSTANFKTRLEQRVCERACLIGMTKEIYHDYEMNPTLRPFLEKSKVFNFPKIRPINSNVAYASFFDQQALNFVYIGTLYEDIRSPLYFFQWLKKCVKIAGRPIKLHFFGTHLVFEDKSIDVAYREIKPYVIEHKHMSNLHLQQIIKEADVLVNINNAITNQVASKLIDYINTGKPILNIIKLKHCRSEEILQDYPKVFHTKESDDLVSSVKNFIKDLSLWPKEAIDHDWILDHYKDYSAQSIVESIKSFLPNEASVSCQE